MTEAIRDATKLLLWATRQDDLLGAVSYLAEGHYIDPKADRTALMRALCEVTAPDDDNARAAMRQLAREVAVSDLDTAAVLLRPDWVTAPSVYRRALDTLAQKCPSRSLAGGVSYRTVVAAQRENPDVLRTLAAVAGLSFKELVQRAGGSAAKDPRSVKEPREVEPLFEVIDAIVCDRVRLDLPGGFPARPMELLADPDVTGPGRSGWGEIERFRTTGVPYEALLAQRVEGGAWRTHRDRTGRKHAYLVADDLCQKLTAAGVGHLRAKNCGGTVSGSRVEQLVGGGRGQVGVVALARDESPSMAILISVANDGGSASKSGLRTAKLAEELNTPVAAVVAGLGWAGRNETADLARVVQGRLFSEKNMVRLVSMLATDPEEPGERT